MTAATTKRGRGRPRKAAEERADVTVHVRFTGVEIEALDAHLEGLRRGSSVGTTVTRTSLIRGLVLAEIGLGDNAGKPGPRREPTKPASKPAKTKTPRTARRPG